MTSSVESDTQARRDGRPSMECSLCGARYLAAQVCTGWPRGSHPKSKTHEVPYFMPGDLSFRVVLRGFSIRAGTSEDARKLAVGSVARQMGGSQRAEAMAERLAPFIDVEEEQR